MDFKVFGKEVAIDHAILDGYKSVYTNKLESVSGPDVHYWHGTLEAFVARPQRRIDGMV